MSYRTKNTDKVSVKEIFPFFSNEEEGEVCKMSKSRDLKYKTVATIPLDALMLGAYIFFLQLFILLLN
jgi:hypothetical protein